MHTNSNTTSADSVNEGKITTNPNVKMSSKPSTVKKRIYKSLQVLQVVVPQIPQNNICLNKLIING